MWRCVDHFWSHPCNQVLNQWRMCLTLMLPHIEYQCFGGTYCSCLLKWKKQYVLSRRWYLSATRQQHSVTTQKTKCEPSSQQRLQIKNHLRHNCLVMTKSSSWAEKQNFNIRYSKHNIIQTCSLSNPKMKHLHVRY